MVLRVDPAAGIGVGPPSPADVVGALDDLEVMARLLQLDAGQKPRHAGADHQNLERPIARGPGRLVRRAVAVQSELFLQQRQVALGDFHPGHEVHQPTQRGRVRRREIGPLTPEQRGQQARGDLDQLGARLRRQPARVRIGERDVSRSPRLAQQVHSPGQLGQGDEQGWKVGLGGGAPHPIRVYDCLHASSRVLWLATLSRRQIACNMSYAIAPRRRRGSAAMESVRLNIDCIQ